MPSGANSKTYELANIVGQTSGVRVSQAFVTRSDIQDTISIEASVKLDEQLNPVIEIAGNIPSELVNDIDHLTIETKYDTINTIDEIDRIFLLGDSFVYYDYSFDDLACDKLGYRIVGYDKSFKKLFTSDYTFIQMSDPQIRKSQLRQKALGGSKKSKHKEINKARTTPSDRMKTFKRSQVD